DLLVCKPDLGVRRDVEDQLRLHVRRRWRSGDRRRRRRRDRIRDVVGGHDWFGVVPHGPVRGDPHQVVERVRGEERTGEDSRGGERGGGGVGVGGGREPGGIGRGGGWNTATGREAAGGGGADRCGHGPGVGMGRRRRGGWGGNIVCCRGGGGISFR